jgi:cell division protein FtsB
MSGNQSPVRRWFDFLALLAVGLAVVYLTVILPNDAKTDRLRAQRDALKADVEGVKTEVDRLSREIDALRKDPYYIERRLRSQIHYLRHGERRMKGDHKLPVQTRKKAPIEAGQPRQG